LGRQLITFDVAGQLFGIDIAAIREIRAWQAVTRVPGIPSYMAGMANLRGAIVPVIDLAARLGWGESMAGPRHAIIVVETQLRGSATPNTCGLIVETVRDLADLGNTPLQTPPGDSSFIEGVAPAGDRLVMVLDLGAVMDPATF